MDYKRALQWAVHYKLLSWVAAVLGLGLFALGWVVGLATLVGAYQSGDVVSALSVGTVVPPLVLTVLGFVVWQLGKTLAFYRTITSAIETEMATRFDAEMVKSDILSVLDERLEEMHQELESANRAIRAIDTGDPAAKAGFDPDAGPGRPGSGGGSSTGGSTGSSTGGSTGTGSRSGGGDSAGGSSGSSGTSGPSTSDRDDSPGGTGESPADGEPRETRPSTGSDSRP